MISVNNLSLYFGGQDIFKNIGVDSLIRVERFKGFEGNGEQHEEIINNYFDRMTESSFSDLD